MYRPAATIRIWATKTLPHLERCAAAHLEEDYVLHLELVLSHKVLPANKRESGHAVVESPDIKATALESGAGTRCQCANKAADPSNLKSMLPLTLLSVLSSILLRLFQPTLPSNPPPSILPSLSP
jgi:hypothetical protein